MNTFFSRFGHKRLLIVFSNNIIGGILLALKNQLSMSFKVNANLAIIQFYIHKKTTAPWSGHHRVVKF